MTMKTKVAETSVMAWREINKTGQVRREKDLALALFIKLNSPLTSRNLSNITNIERSSCCRIINELVKESKLEISHRAKCGITKKEVHYYKLVTDPQCS